MVVKGDSGQSVLEFMMMMPMLIGMAIILMRINMAIQVSIVNQQYSRAQALFLTYNSPHYPALDKQMGDLVRKSMNQMVVGVSENVAKDTAYVPKAPVQMIARSKKVRASDAPHEEPAARANVRIRNTVTLCTQTIFLKTDGGGAVPILPLTGPPWKPTGSSMLGENNAMSMFKNICGSNIGYE